ncbi:MAG: hypothetical protein WC519_00635 [Parcubacteria group bacterium]
MNISQNKIKFPSVFAAIMILAIPSVSYASDLSSATENLNTSTNQLIEAKDGADINVLSAEEELSYRRKVVSDALTLSYKEIESAREKLDATSLDEKSDSGKIRSAILLWLEEEEKYFKGAEDELTSESLDLEGIKDLARDIKAHRDDNYNKKLADALDFIFALEASRLTDTATDRWNKIDTDLKKLEKAGLIKKDLFSADMTEAKKMIDGARALIEKALSSSVKIYLPAPEEENQEVTENNNEIVIEEEEIPSARDLFEAAIVNLKSAYGEFVKISTAVKKLLRLP